MLRFSKQHAIRIIGIVSALGIGVALCLFGDGFVVGQGEIQTDTRLEIGLWTQGTLIEQTFTASQNNLARLDVWINSYRSWDSPFLECRLFESDLQQQPVEFTYGELHQHLKEVRVKRLNGWLLSPHMFNPFEFEPIPDSQGKRYLLSIQSPELTRGGSSIILASARKRLDDEQFFVNGTRKESDLAFRALYAQSRVHVLQKTFARIALQKPAPFSFPSVYYLLFFVYIAILILFVRQL